MKGDHYIKSLKKRQGLLIVIIAALTLEVLSGVQYYYTHRLMEQELEKRAELDLTMKALLIKSNLNDAEDILNNHMWRIQDNLDKPDSVYTTMKRMVKLGVHLLGGGVGFEPYYYPEKGRLFEVYARRNADGDVEAVQIGGDDHDYTQLDFYQTALTDKDGLWVDPYVDTKGAQATVTSFLKPVHDSQNKAVGVVSVDLSLKWLTDTIDRRHIYPSSFIVLLTESGAPVIRPSEERVSKETADSIIRFINDSTVTRQKSTSGQTTVIHFETDKRDGTIFYANMKGKPHWQIAVVCYDDEVYASLNLSRLWYLLLMVAAFGILLFVVWRFAHGVKKLEEKTMEEERLVGELRIANGIQQALLPEEEPSLMGVNEVSVEGRLIPAKVVAGDLYNVFVRDGKLFFCIGDVTGKGVPAALIMAIIQSLFRNIASRENNAAHIMSQLNEAGCRNNKSNMFVTLFVGVLDLPTGHLRYCNAGHEVPILIRNEEPGTQLLDVKANLPVGIFSDFKYEMQEMVMQPGETLFLYTDGLTEAKNAQGDLFGRTYVKQLAESLDNVSPKELVKTVVAEVERFSEHTEQSDDLTLLAISYTPQEEQLILDEELTLPNDVKAVSTLSTFVKDVMTRLNIGKPLAPKLRLALEEAVVNVMEYAYPAGSKGEINIRVTSDGQQLKFIITDTGISFDPTIVSTADTTLSAKERPVGGLGILLVRELMDSINYERTDGKNVLILKKRNINSNH